VAPCQQYSNGTKNFILCECRDFKKFCQKILEEIMAISTQIVAIEAEKLSKLNIVLFIQWGAAVAQR
jgi:hypothetical protein